VKIIKYADKETIKYAKIAAQAWEGFVKDGDNRQRICKFFHLRPTSKGITVITTLDNCEMRGVEKNAKNLIALLEEIDKNYEILVSLNDVKRKAIMESLKFRSLEKASSKSERKIQATMINTMSKDKNLSEILEANDHIRFIASELTFGQKKHSVDIVGFDGQDIYFFELKKERTEKVEQVKGYIEYYSKERDILKQLLENYPINNVEKFSRLIGVMVMKYAENSVAKQEWQELAMKNGIHILFYKPSLIYVKNVA